MGYRNGPGPGGAVQRGGRRAEIETRQLSRGPQWLATGPEKAQLPFDNACSRFLCLEDLGQPVAAEEPRGAKAAKPKPQAAAKGEGEAAPACGQLRQLLRDGGQRRAAGDADPHVFLAYAAPRHSACRLGIDLDHTVERGGVQVLRD